MHLIRPCRHLVAFRRPRRMHLIRPCRHLVAFRPLLRMHLIRLCRHLVAFLRPNRLLLHRLCRHLVASLRSLFHTRNFRTHLMAFHFLCRKLPLLPPRRLLTVFRLLLH